MIVSFRFKLLRIVVLIFLMSSPSILGICVTPKITLDTPDLEFRTSSNLITNKNSLFQSKLWDYGDYVALILNLTMNSMWNENTGEFYRAVTRTWSDPLLEATSYEQGLTLSTLCLLSKENTTGVIDDTGYNFLQIGEKLANFTLVSLWDSQNKGFYYSTLDKSHKQSGAQAQMVSSLLDLYDITKNTTYLNYAIDTLSFMLDYMWDNINGGFYFATFPNGSLPQDPETLDSPNRWDTKRTHHLALGGLALLKAYIFTNDVNYLDKATDSYDFLEQHILNTSKNLFYTNSRVDGINTAKISENTFDTFSNSLTINFMVELYETTGEENYLSLAEETEKSLITNLWDPSYGGFFASTFDNNSLRDPLKYLEREFYALRAIDALYRETNSIYIINLIHDILEFVISRMWDNTYGGFFTITTANGNRDEEHWEEKVLSGHILAIEGIFKAWSYSAPTVTQILWDPIEPTPQDNITIAALVSDTDGISKVLLNFSLGAESYNLALMDLNPNVSNMYQIFLGLLGDGTAVNFEVVANDTFGNVIQRGNYFFKVREDVWGPLVELININPSETVIRADQKLDAVVSATERPSHKQVLRVELILKVKGESTREELMINSFLNFWKIEFGPFGEDKTVTFYFKATDWKGNVGVSEIYEVFVAAIPDESDLTQILIILALFGVVIPSSLYLWAERRRGVARGNFKKTAGRKKRISTGKRRHRSMRGKKRSSNY